MEAAVGFEPTHEGFADPCLTTWLRRPVLVWERFPDYTPGSLVCKGGPGRWERPGGPSAESLFRDSGPRFC
jgi:hypothetical protein